MTGAVKNSRITLTESVYADKIGKLTKKFEGIFFPLLLCIVMMSGSVYIYTENVADRYTVFSAVFGTALFALFSRLRKLKFGGFAYFGILMLIMIFTPNLFLTSWRSRMEFIQWFFSGAEMVETRTNFMITFVIMFGFFFCSVVYYFTQVVYRSSAIILISLIPMALSVKVTKVLPEYYSMILASINLIIFIFYSRRDITDKSFSGNKFSAMVVYTDFAAAAILLAIIIPKPLSAPFYERFEGFMNRFQFGVSRETVMNGEYNRYSGNADDLLRQESRLLYIVSSPEPAYMKTQVFDFFDPEFNRWESSGNQVSGNRNWQETADLLNYEKLASAIEKAAEHEPGIYESYPSALMLNEITESETFSTVYPNEFPAAYVIAPLRSKSVNLSSTGARYSARSEAGEIFTDLDLLPSSSAYTVRYYSENIFYKMLENGLCDISADDYGELLGIAADSLSRNGYDEEYNVVNAFRNEYLNAMEYAAYTATEVSPEIQELSDSITAGLEYDYEKAKALEQFFYDNGFIYNLTYQAPEESDTTEFFLFESRIGTCSDYASAYTLLARAAGLTVRYAEGFVPNAGEDPREGLYYIFTENAHAYPEVFIPGAGWIRYEPTVGNLSGSGNGTDSDNSDGYYTFLFTAIIATVVIGFFILLMILSPKITESIFRLKVKFADNDSAIKMLYNRHTKRAGTKYKVNSAAMTAEEVSLLTKEKTGIPLEPLSASFTEICYGGRSITREKRDFAYECYKSQTKEMNRRKRKD